MQEPRPQIPASPKRKRLDCSPGAMSPPPRRKTETPLGGDSSSRTLVFRNLTNGELKQDSTQRCDDGVLAPPLEIPESPFVRPRLSPCPLFRGPFSLDLWWKDAEITGRDPKDPADDGYGINGIGFNPTPAMANARAQHRRKQVAEWKNREAKEARQRRIEMRRHRGDQDSSNTSTPEDEARKVRFFEPQA